MSLLHPQSRIFCGILAGRAMCMNDASLTWMMKFIILCKFFFYGASTYLISTEGIILMFTTELVLNQSEHDLLFSLSFFPLSVLSAPLHHVLFFFIFFDSLTLYQKLYPLLNYTI
jgi:hypothetical protein